MNKNKISDIIKKTATISDRKFARDLRISALEALVKVADDHGILQHFRGTPAVYDSPEHYLAERGGEDDSELLYGVGYPKREKADLSTDVYNRSLSTRYSPDRVGVQARRIADGVYQDPITNKVYDWNEGFTTEDGAKFEGGKVSLQTDIMYGK